MPDIKLQHIVSFSSEDKNHPAENLLKPGGSHKWKSSAPGEKQLSAVIQLEKACQIHSIDIGNEGSAFVELLVGRSSSSDHDFEVILVSSSFMSPMESRNGTNRNSVRMFGPDKLSKSTAAQKWDRVKVVCTQPFNKTSTFGLSFITLHSTPEPGEKDNSSNKEQSTKALGAFRLKSDPEEKGSLKVGTLFAKRDQEKQAPPPITGAAAIRAASKLAEEAQEAKTTPPKPSPSSSRSTQKRKHSGSDEETKSKATPPPKIPLKKHSTSISSISSTASSGGRSKASSPPPLKKTKSEPPTESPAKELGKVMSGVVFVLSGYTNPRRGEVRDKALKMGAQYRPDWGQGCTHLVCAFANTPKYNAVLGKGKIVTHHWINDCYKKKRLFNWKDYRCGDADTPDEDSEEEEEIIPKKKAKITSKSPSVEKKKEKDESEEDIYGGDTDPEDSGEDTEDELRKLKEKPKGGSSEKLKEGSSEKLTGGSSEKPKGGSLEKPTGGSSEKLKSADKMDEDPYGGSTDEDEPEKSSENGSKPSPTKHDDSDSGLPELPDFFTDKNFFLYGDFAASERRLLVRYITAFNGDVCDYMTDDISYVLTNSKWDKNFDEALSDAPSLVFVKPKWVFMCNEKNKLVPYQPYIVVPE